MTPEEIELVEVSARLIPPIAEPAAAMFYDALFTLDPTLRPLFAHADMHEQGRKLMAAIGLVVGNLRRPEALLPAVAELGRRHSGYGVLPAHYETVGEALLATLATGLGPAFTPAVRDAWTKAYTLVARTMQQAAAVPTARAA
jgi:hemoglobin-like flavoprotein